ncbi:MAG TPA: fatty acid CoA ligase family protein [Planctomycetota bacterium]
MTYETFNIAQFLPQQARLFPERPAIICSHRADGLGRHSLTFAQLDAESDQIALGLRNSGLQAGARVLLMVRPGLELISLTFGLFKAGTVPVLIDPGMGRKNLLDCVRQSKPEAFIGIPLAHALRVLAGGDAFSGVKLLVTVGRRWFWGGMTLEQVRIDGGTGGRGDAGKQKVGSGSRQDAGTAEAGVMAATTRETPAAILFTSGSTGIPKGVLYTHGMFGAQVEIIREQFGIQPGEIDLPAFALFALFSTALGVTCVIPDMDPTRPAQCDPAKIVKALQEQRVTYSFGSPAIWKRVGPYCLENKIKLPHLKRILMAGAPVRGEVLAPFAKILSEDADTFIPYGATESLPVSTIRGSEVLNETWALTRQGKGHCVGRPVPGMTVRIIRPEPLRVADCGPETGEAEVWDNGCVLPPGQIGEIVVKGPVVTQEYYGMPEQTRAAKIYEFAPSDPNAETLNPEPRTLNPAVWHRMGDMGYFDEKGRLWFCGRKAHRVVLANGKVLYSVCVEAVFEEALAAAVPKWSKQKTVRAALAGVGQPGQHTAVIVVEFTDELHDAMLDINDTPMDFMDMPEFTRWFENSPWKSDVKHVLHWEGPFPVDVRHNAKINREQLSKWAEKRLHA